MPFTFPDPNTTPEFTGKNGITYVWDADDSKWQVKGYEAGDYVKKQGGDEMEGPLDVTGGRNPDADGIVSTIDVLNVDSGEDSDLHLRRNGATRIYVGKSHNNYIGDIKIGSSNAKVIGPTDFQIGYFGNEAMFYKGKIADETSIVNRKYVDSADNKLQQNIIELEEEINAIAPSVEYGTWEWQNPSNTGRPPVAGTFHLLDDSIQPTDQYKNTKFIRIHNDEYKAADDSDPVDSHTWADADPGKLIQLYDAADPDFLLGEIISTVTDEPSQSVTIEVQLIQTSGVPNDNSVNGKYLTRINVFAPPSGGTADGFVLKTGDEMTGKLTLKNATAIDLKGKIQVNGTTTNSRFLGTDSYGNTSWKTALTSQTQADWNTTSSSSASFIKNKPDIPTINYQISKDSYGNYYVS